MLSAASTRFVRLKMSGGSGKPTTGCCVPGRNAENPEVSGVVLAGYVMENAYRAFWYEAFSMPSKIAAVEVASPEVEGKPYEKPKIMTARDSTTPMNKTGQRMSEV